MCSPRHAMPGNHADGTIRLLAIWGVTLTLAFAATFAHAITLTAAQSRKSHGAAGTFDLPIDTTQNIGGAVTVEPRAIGAGHMIVFQFDAPITAIGIPAAFDEAGAPVGALTASAAGNEVVVTLAGVPDNKRVTVLLSNVNGAGMDAFASLGFLVGDVNNSRSVTATDILQVKGRSGQGVDATNFTFDLNASGSITASDILAVKGRSGQTLPAAISGIDIARSFFVATTGLDTNPGTMAAPFRTIQRGINAAAADGVKKHVLVAAGTYVESVMLANGVSLFGQFDAASNWSRSALNVTTITSATPLTVSDYTADGFIEGFTITSTNAVVAGASSRALVLQNAGSGLSIRYNTIIAGNGAGGSAGTNGSAGLGGSNGTAGQMGTSTNASGSGGAGGVNSSCAGANGGRGGKGGYFEVFNDSGLGIGFAGLPSAAGVAGGAGGSHDPTCVGEAGRGGGGSAGAAATHGTNGLGGAGGVLMTLTWVSNSGTGGTLGSFGSGGGGGGGGGGAPPRSACLFLTGGTWGGGGGGGGAGGCGGAAGTGGGGGGGSIGIVSSASAAVIVSNTITTGNGGSGGDSGNGGGGGAGTSGAVGGSGTARSGGGGLGGAGIPGGTGGCGGGGAGGPSIALLRDSESQVLGPNNVTLGVPGAGGSGGLGGSGACQPGQSGIAGEIVTGAL